MAATRNSHETCIMQVVVTPTVSPWESVIVFYGYLMVYICISSNFCSLQSRKFPCFNDLFIYFSRVFNFSSSTFFLIRIEFSYRSFFSTKNLLFMNPWVAKSSYRILVCFILSPFFFIFSFLFSSFRSLLYKLIDYPTFRVLGQHE